MRVKTASAIGVFQLRTTAVSSTIGADEGTPGSSVSTLTALPPRLRAGLGPGLGLGHLVTTAFLPLTFAGLTRT